MTVAAAQVEPLARQLADVLDEAIDLEGTVLEELKDLSVAATARDDRAMEALMNRLRETRDRLETAERRRQGVRLEIAAATGCPAEEVTVEALARLLGPGEAAALRARRDRVRQVTETVRAQYLRTAMFLAEFARVNRSLLEGLLPRRTDARTYGTRGEDSWQPEPGLFDARL